MTTYITQSTDDTAPRGIRWHVVNPDTEHGDCMDFATRQRAVQFRQCIKHLKGDTLQELFDNYCDQLIDIIRTQHGLTYDEAFATVDRNFC